MTEETPNNDLFDGLNKNAKEVSCEICKSKILNSGAGTFISSEHVIPFMKLSKQERQENIEGETLKNYWCVDNIYGFENVAFSNTVGAKTKYLVCADCEAGPIGFYDIESKKSYVALKRVKHY